MTKITLLLAFSSMVLFASCQQNASEKKQANTPGTVDQNNKSSKPDPNDLLQILQGRWQNIPDPNYILEIADTQMRHIKNGEMTYQSMIDVDGSCQSPVCKPDGMDTSEGWCFTEMSVVKERYAAQCNFITLCSTDTLRYQVLGGSGKVLTFKKNP